MKSVVFANAGIGNFLLTVPLLKHLKENGEVVVVVTASQPLAELASAFIDFPANRIVTVRRWWHWLLLVPLLSERFNSAYLDYFAATRKWHLVAWLLASRVVSNKRLKLPAVFLKRWHFVPPQPGLHEGNQYLKYVQEVSTQAPIEREFSLNINAVQSGLIKGLYITVQPLAGNGLAPWKSWPHWISFLEAFITRHPNISIVLVGDKAESAQWNTRDRRIINLMGKTKMKELPSLIANASCHVGGDSGFIHLAGCVGTPTVSIVGGSDHLIYGWQNINPAKHLTVRHHLPCHPCSRWILPNRSRVENPALCPDFACIRSVSVAEVITAVDIQLANEK